jgi:hypothetical protein
MIEKLLDELLHKREWIIRNSSFDGEKNKEVTELRNHIIDLYSWHDMSEKPVIPDGKDSVEVILDDGDERSVREFDKSSIRLFCAFITKRWCYIPRE